MNRPYTLTCLFLLISWLTLAQPVPTPPIPAQVSFAGISVNFDDGARSIIQQDVRALLSNRQFWQAKLDRVVLYFPTIEAILTDEEVPTDFKYLAVQESSLLPDAISSSQAVGFWQFKEGTAIDHGMRVDSEVDERRSINASTHGAAKYLKRSNGIYNNWVSALYSYYLGTGGISKLISPDWAYAKEIYLDGQTDRYMLRFFAHKIAIESAIASHQTANTIALVEYPKASGKALNQVAEEVGVDPAELRKYNRWVLADNIPNDKAYSLMVPTPNNQINDVRQKIGQATDRPTADFSQNDIGFPVLRKITTGVQSKNDPILYEINGLPGIQAQAGDNAGSLARKARVSLSSFLRYNELGELDQIVPGEVYYLAKKRKKALVPYHTVREDETIRSIAQRYGIRTKFIMRYNRLDRVQKLQVGRVMWLREKRPRDRPVEVINSPTPPVYDRTPAIPSNQPGVNRATASTPADQPADGNPTRSSDYPKTAADRKVYTPKLAGTPIDEPATKPAPAPTSPVPSAPVNTPARTSPAPSRSADNPAGTQRVVIVRDGSGTSTTTTPVGTPANPTRQPAGIDESSIPTDDKPPINVPTKPSGNGGFEVTGNPSTAGRTTGTKAKPFTPPASSTPKTEPVTTPVKTPATTTPKGGRSMTHTVQGGQTYYSISKIYGIAIDDLLAWNNLTLEDRLSVGQQLSIRNVPAGFPVGQEVRPSAGSGSQPKEDVVYHTVQKGETMFRISKQYNVSVEQIQQWNALTDVTVKEGQKIKIIK